MKRLRILLAGYGTVGKAFHQMVQDGARGVADEFGVKLDVVAVTRSKGAWLDPNGLSPTGLRLEAKKESTTLDLIQQGVADVLVEASPTDLRTGGAGLSHVRAALHKGLHVVTANKGPVVVAYPELKRLAAEKKVQFRFEATAGAALPLMSLKEFCLRGDRVRRLEGVLNGTCNYILTRMGEEGLDFQQALQEAQALGYAEADPTADVGGHDAAAKLVILANHYFGEGIALKDVKVTGITEVSGEAVQLAMKQGYVVRLVATVDRSGPAIVAPRLVPVSSPLNVPGTLNVVRIYAENAGPIAVSGHGAGGKRTASALLSDCLTVALA